MYLQKSKLALLGRAYLYPDKDRWGARVLLLFEQFYNLWLFKDVVLYALYVHCTHVRLSYVINFYFTYLQNVGGLPTQYVPPPMTGVYLR